MRIFNAPKVGVGKYEKFLFSSSFYGQILCRIQK